MRFSLEIGGIGGGEKPDFFCRRRRRKQRPQPVEMRPFGENVQPFAGKGAGDGFDGRGVAGHMRAATPGHLKNQNHETLM